jgi:hypothetical protein
MARGDNIALLRRQRALALIAHGHSAPGKGPCEQERRLRRRACIAVAAPYARA